MDIILHLLSTKEIEANEELILDVIDKERIIKANRYIKRNDYLLSIGGSYLINKYTGPLSIKYLDSGKPYKDNIEFSLSHSNEYVILATSDSPIGIDIEKIKDINPSLIDYSFSESDVKEIKTKEQFFSRWVLKESLGKCVGTGLKGRIKEIPSTKGLFNYMGESFSSKSIKYEDYMIGVCIKKNTEINIIRIEVESI